MEGGALHAEVQKYLDCIDRQVLTIAVDDVMELYTKCELQYFCKISEEFPFGSLQCLVQICKASKASFPARSLNEGKKRL